MSYKGYMGDCNPFGRIIARGSSPVRGAIFVEAVRTKSSSSRGAAHLFQCHAGVIALLLFLITKAYGAPATPTPDDYFNGGATNYVFGDKQKAKEEVLTGIQQFPKDPKLNQLMVLLKKEDQQKQQQQQQQQNQQKNDQNKDQKQNQNSQKNKSDQKKDQQKSNEQQKNQDQKKQDQAKDDANQKKDQQQQRQKADQKKQDKSEQNPEQGQTYAAGQMTPQQAKQLLDAQKGDEMIIPVRPQGKPRDPNKPLRDW